MAINLSPLGTSGISHCFRWLSPTLRQILTRYSPVRHSPEGAFDLHVLSIPPAFILSQDQTLHGTQVVFFLSPTLSQPLGITLNRFGILGFSFGQSIL